jgi:hypothetical protein
LAVTKPHQIAGAWSALDWSAPWFAPVCGVGLAVQASGERALSLAQALSLQPSPAGGPAFVPQADLPEGTAYEQHIFTTGCVPTRDNLHDFFNGLVWLRFPLTKRRLNHLQAQQIAQAASQVRGEAGSQVRGPVRDALTLFDENAALLQAPDAIWQALLARDWQRLFGELRPHWGQARLVLFGHALLEKLVTPYKSITAHVYREPVPLALGDDLARWDVWLADRLSASELASKPFTPLPVLGVPGWWSANEDSVFYQDTTVFRPARHEVPDRTGIPFTKSRT